MRIQYIFRGLLRNLTHHTQKLSVIAESLRKKDYVVYEKTLKMFDQFAIRQADIF